MKTNKTLCKIIRAVHLDAMNPEFKAANAELLKAIKMNDKSGAVPHADLEAVNKAMKANDAEKVGTVLKKVQLQFLEAEKKLDDEVKDVTARLAEAKKDVEKSKINLKASKADAALFDKARKVSDGIKANPRNASKLSPIADKLKKYGDLSKRVGQIVTLASSNKDVSKQVDMLKKAIDAAEKKYKKEAANVEREAKKAKDELDVLNMRVKVTQGKKDAFTKERLYIANVVKQMSQGDLRQKREGIGTSKSVEPNGDVLVSTSNDKPSTNKNTEKKRTTASFISGKSGKIGYGAYLSIEGNEITVEVKSGFPTPYILRKGIWMEIPTIGVEAWVPEGDPRFRSKGGKGYLVWGKYQKEIP